MRKRLKSLAFWGIANPLRTALTLRRMVTRGDVAILNFHRIGPEDGSSWAPLASDLFEDIIAFCRKAGRVLTIEELKDCKPSDRPTFVISFDDGFMDFVDHALPILRKHGVRCNHNFIPTCVDEGLPPLNVQLQDFIGKAPQALVDEMIALLPYPIAPGQSRERIGFVVSDRLKRQPIAEQEQLFQTVRATVEKAGDTATPMMRLADLRAVSDEVEIGAHSFDHATLDTESEAYVTDDAKRCKAWFKSSLGIDPAIYAVPNGGATDRQVEILRDEGFSTVLRVDERFSSSAQRIHPRFSIYGESKGEVRGRSLGLRAAS